MSSPTMPLDRDLKGKSVRSGAVTVASQAIQFALQLASTAILARLLLPADFGIVAMALSLTAFAEVFKNMGLSTATIQRADVSHAQINTMFWLNIVVGAFLMLAIMALAPVLAWFYHKPELISVTLVLSSTFLIGSLGIQHGALLNREMRFGTLAGIQITSAVAGIAVAIAAAAAGAGYWALVARWLVGSLAAVSLFWTFSPWRPDRPAIFEESAPYSTLERM